jgi:hypothetical protein
MEKTKKNYEIGGKEMSDDRCDELRRFERNYPGSVPFTTPSQAEKIFEQRMEAEIERNRAKDPVREEKNE